MKKILTIILLLLTNNCFAAITFDSVSSDFINSGSSFNLSHTLGSGSNRIVLATYTQENNSSSCSSITYNGSNMTKVGTVTNGANSAEIWYILEASLPSAGTYTVAFTCTGLQSWTVSAISLFGAAQTAPEASASNTNTANASITSSITTLTNGAWVVDAIACGETGALSATESGQTERHDLSAGTTMQGGSSTKEVATAGSTNMSWTGGGTNRKAHYLISVAPSSTSNYTVIKGATIQGAKIN